MGKIYTDIWNANVKNLDAMDGLAYVTENPNGAESLFVGTVRDFNHGKISEMQDCQKYKK